MVVARRGCDARPSRKARWQSTHWVARREDHGEGERGELAEDEHEHYTQGSLGTSAGSEERLPVVMERACLARVGERGKEWSQAGKGTQ